MTVMTKMILIFNVNSLSTLTNGNVYISSKLKDLHVKLNRFKPYA